MSEQDLWRSVQQARLGPEAARGVVIENVRPFTGHSSLAVTTTYLRRLEGQEDRGWHKVAAALGV